MRTIGQMVVNAPRNAAWMVIGDTAVLVECMRGCRRIEQMSETEYRLILAAKVGPVDAQLSGRVTVSEVLSAQRCTLAFEGKGSVGFVKGEARVHLEEIAAQTTLLTYVVTVRTGGKLAQIVSRFVEASAHNLIVTFFHKLRAKIENRGYGREGASSFR